MQFKFYIIDDLEYLEVCEDGECVNTLTQPFCENVLKVVNDDGMLSRSVLGLYTRNIFLYWADEQELDETEHCTQLSPRCALRWRIDKVSQSGFYPEETL